MPIPGNCLRDNSFMKPETDKNEVTPSRSEIAKLAEALNAGKVPMTDRLVYDPVTDSIKPCGKKRRTYASGQTIKIHKKRTN